MLKSSFLVVKAVGKLVNFSGVFCGLFSAVKNTGFGVVYKNRGLYKVLQAVLLNFIHVLNRLFSSVSRFVIPIIHKTYYKLQLVILNTLLLITRRFYEA